MELKVFGSFVALQMILVASTSQTMTMGTASIPSRIVEPPITVFSCFGFASAMRYTSNPLKGATSAVGL